MKKTKAIRVLNRRIKFLEDRISKTPEEKRQFLEFDQREIEAMKMAVDIMSVSHEFPDGELNENNS